MNPTRCCLALSLVLLVPRFAVAETTTRAADENTGAAETTAPAVTLGDPESAEGLVARGIELRKAGDDRGALAAFTRAFQVDRSARARAQMALAEQALGRWVEAHDHLQEALLQGTDPWIEERRASLAAALEEIERQLGALEVSCNVPGAAIYLDGRLVGHAPLSGAVKLVAGQSVITITAAGHFNVVRQVQVDAGALSRIEVTLTPNVEAAAHTSRHAVVDTRAEPTAGRDWLMYGSIGLAGIGVTLGVTGYVMREINVRLYNDDSRCRQNPEVPRSNACPDEAAAFRRGEVIAIAGFSAAGVFGALGLYLWLDRPKNSKRAELSCVPGIAAIECAGRF